VVGVVHWTRERGETITKSGPHKKRKEISEIKPQGAGEGKGWDRRALRRRYVEKAKAVTRKERT